METTCKQSLCPGLVGGEDTEGYCRDCHDACCQEWVEGCPVCGLQNVVLDSLLNHISDLPLALVSCKHWACDSCMSASFDASDGKCPICDLKIGSVVAEE